MGPSLLFPGEIHHEAARRGASVYLGGPPLSWTLRLCLPRMKAGPSFFNWPETLPQSLGLLVTFLGPDVQALWDRKKGTDNTVAQT